MHFYGLRLKVTGSEAMVKQKSCNLEGNYVELQHQMCVATDV